MSGALPEYLDLTKAGQAPLRLTGQLNLNGLRRLGEAVTDSGGQAHVDLQVFDAGGRKVVWGRVQADLSLTCQRCFGKLGVPVTADFNLAWVRRAEEAARLPETYEPLISADGRVQLADVIEEELLLALPMVARHERPSECGKMIPRASRPRAGAVDVALVKPFAALKALKRR
ncbi:MAG: YceD family protein [Gammaproteobacteria bacterium]